MLGISATPASIDAQSKRIVQCRGSPIGGRADSAGHCFASAAIPLQAADSGGKARRKLLAAVWAGEAPRSADDVRRFQDPDKIDLLHSSRLGVADAWATGVQDGPRDRTGSGIEFHRLLCQLSAEQHSFGIFTTTHTV